TAATSTAAAATAAAFTRLFRGGAGHRGGHGVSFGVATQALGLNDLHGQGVAFFHRAVAVQILAGLAATTASTIATTATAFAPTFRGGALVGLGTHRGGQIATHGLERGRRAFTSAAVTTTATVAATFAAFLGLVTLPALAALLAAEGLSVGHGALLVTVAATA